MVAAIAVLDLVQVRRTGLNPATAVSIKKRWVGVFYLEPDRRRTKPKCYDSQRCQETRARK
jgi:hypothetical protein